MDVSGLLLVLAPAAPAVLALLWPVRPLRRALVALAPWAAAPALLLAVHPAPEVVRATLPAVFTGLELVLDPTGRYFLLFTALLWLAAGAFARVYHRADPRRDGFMGFFVLTMTGNLGLLVAADTLSFYLFFALMTFAAYGLVVHGRDRAALRAGRIYIVMGVLGEICILAALFSLGWAAGGAALFGDPLQGAWEVLGEAGAQTVVAGLLVAGFGIKAGVAPLHLWLPLAHPVAPTAASALLSGAMIKAGLLAWLRFLPPETALPEVGGALILAGVASAFYGVLVGLGQEDPKTVLAYSSVSQMGYMAVGAGLLAFSPGWEPLAVVGVAAYAIHHGVAKGALFLAVGVGDRSAGLRGTRARWAFLAAAALPALALAGAPFTAGAMAKGTLKEALSELGGGWYPSLDPILLAAAVGTTLLMARFLLTLDRRLPARNRNSRPGADGGVEGPPPGLLVPWLALVFLGALGFAWIPAVLPVPGAVLAPTLGSVLIESLLPVLGGGLVAWLAWRSPAFLGRIGTFSPPPGDLVVPIEKLVTRLGSVAPPGLGPGPVGPPRAFRRSQIWSHGLAAWMAERDLYLARGPLLALLLLGLGLLLGFLLP